MEIKVLGTGCKKCKQLEQNTRDAVHAIELDATVEKVEDLGAIMKYGVMSTPALVINDQVVSTGKVLSVEEVKQLISQHR